MRTTDLPLIRRSRLFAQVAEPDLSVREARLGDRYLLCSDGLHGVVSNDEIARILKPDGLFLGALLGGATLWQLRQALTAAMLLAAPAAAQPSGALVAARVAALVTAIGWCCLLGYAIYLIAEAWWDSRPLNILQVIVVPVLLLVVIRAIRRYLQFRANP